MTFGAQETLIVIRFLVDHRIFRVGRNRSTTFGTTLGEQVVVTWRAERFQVVRTENFFVFQRFAALTATKTFDVIIARLVGDARVDDRLAAVVTAFRLVFALATPRLIVENRIGLRRIQPASTNRTHETVRMVKAMVHFDATVLLRIDRPITFDAETQRRAGRRRRAGALLQAFATLKRRPMTMSGKFVRRSIYLESRALGVHRENAVDRLRAFFAGKTFVMIVAVVGLSDARAVVKWQHTRRTTERTVEIETRARRIDELTKRFRPFLRCPS